MQVYISSMKFMRNVNYIVGFQNFAGLCGALMIGGGIIGAAIAGVFVDKTKKFEEVAKISFAMAALAGVAFTEVSDIINKLFNVNMQQNLDYYVT